MNIINTWINEEQTCTNCGTEVQLDLPADLYHSFRYGNRTWYCPICQKANRASERPRPVSFAEAMTNLGLAIAKTDQGGGARNSEKNR